MSRFEKVLSFLCRKETILRDAYESIYGGYEAEVRYLFGLITLKHNSNDIADTYWIKVFGIKVWANIYF